MTNLELTPGSRFAERFDIETVAGSGGMGTVYRALDSQTGELVALKLLHEGLGGTEENRRFIREAQLLSELRHPNIVSHVTHGQTAEGQRFLAMEWLNGEDLGQRLLRGPLKVGECVLLIEQLAEALSATHQRGILHRDLKPTNVFLVNGEIGCIKLLDLGIARRISTSNSLTRAGAVIGTPEYMAPEQARGVRELTPAADFFSLGCILYECLTGQPPFLADHIAAVLVRILFEEPIPIEERRPGVPQKLRTLVAQLLIKEPGLRLADIPTLRAALAACEQEPALSPTLAGPPAKLPAFAESEQSLLSVVLAAPAEVGLGSEVTLRPSDILQRQEREALMSTLQRMSVSADFLAVGALVVTVSPTGSAIDQVARAVRAALHIKERWPAAVVSVATGRGMIQGRTTVGEVVEAAARVFHSKQPFAELPSGAVILDALSTRLLDGRFPLQSHDGGTFLVSDAQETDASRLLLGKPTLCVGRDLELNNLEAQLRCCVEESEPAVVLITAPPGVGKSRLRHEFMNRMLHRASPPTMLVGRGDLTNAGCPYGILGQAVRRLCGILDSEPIEMQREQLQTRIGQHLAAPTQHQILLFIGEFSGVPFSDENQPMLSSARQDPRILSDCVRQAFVDWLRAECQFAPVLVILDDLQWGDSLSVGLLDDALRQLGNAPLFVLGLGRPELQDTFRRLWQAHRPQELSLKGLGKKASERFVLHMLGGQASAEEVAHIVEQAAGNALFLEELIRSFVDKTSDAPVETVLAMLQARIGRLETASRRALLAASIYGQTFWLGGITQVLELAAIPAEVESWLTKLSEAELIEPNSSSRFIGQQEYSFRHALVCDAAYALLTEHDRTTGHQLAAQFMESSGERDSALVASHYQRGGELGRAAVFFARAADYALERFDLKAALHYAERASSCGPDAALLAALQAIEGVAHAFMGQPDRAFAIGRSALSSLPAGSTAWARALCGAVMGAIFGRTEYKAELPALAMQILTTDPDREAETIYAEMLHSLVQGMSTAVPVAQVRPLLQRLEQICRRATSYNPALWRYHQGACVRTNYHCTPHPFTTLREAEEAKRRCLQAGDMRTGGFLASFVIAPSWLNLGGFDRAEEVLSAAWELACTTREYLLQCSIQTKRAELYLLRGDPGADARIAAYLNETIERMAAIPAAVGESHDLLARLLLRQGNAEGAEVTARKACQYLETLPNYLPNVYAVLIYSLLAQDKSADALEEAYSALNVLQTFDCVGHAEVELRLAISEAFRVAGDRPRASLELQAAQRQINLRAEDITDSFWKNSYLTRNPYCVRTKQLEQEWQ